MGKSSGWIGYRALDCAGTAELAPDVHFAGKLVLLHTSAWSLYECE